MKGMPCPAVHSWPRVLQSEEGSGKGLGLMFDPRAGAEQENNHGISSTWAENSDLVRPHDWVVFGEFENLLMVDGRATELFCGDSSQKKDKLCLEEISTSLLWPVQKNQTYPAKDFSGCDLKFLGVGVAGERRVAEPREGL